MSKLITERTSTGEGLVLVAEVLGEALAAGMSAFEETYIGEVKYLDRAAVAHEIAALLAQQLTPGSNTRTVVKSYFVETAVAEDVVEIDGGCV